MTCFLPCRRVCLKDVKRTANTVDHDQTAPSGSTLFVQLSFVSVSFGISPVEQIRRVSGDN